MSTQLKHRYTLEEYFEIDRTSDAKWEFWDGEIFCMIGASPEHNQVSVNLLIGLGSKVIARGCRVFGSDMRVKVPAYPPYRYPDLSGLCGEPIYEPVGGVEALTNPSLIIEILPPSTEAFDRGDKFTYYKSIPSFAEYLLIAQHRPHVTQLQKEAGGVWTYREMNSFDETLHVASLDCVLSLSEIYRAVEFKENARRTPDILEDGLI